MISTGDLKRGMTIDLDGELQNILEYPHIKIGRGSAQVRIKMRNVKTGSIVERTYQSGEKFRRAIVDRKNVQYLYHEDSMYTFMDTETYEQTTLSADQLADDVSYLTDGQMLDILTYQEEPIGVELPPNVVLTVEKTDPGFRGDTATGGTKPATMETGLVVNVPLFVNEGDRLRVDTRTGGYVERA